MRILPLFLISPSVLLQNPTPWKLSWGKNVQKEVKKAVGSCCSSCATFPRGERGKTAGFRGDKSLEPTKKEGLREMESTEWSGGS